jgi:hypothetical protein
VLKALTYGKPVSLLRLCSALSLHELPPNCREWDALEEACTMTGTDVSDPKMAVAEMLAQEGVMGAAWAQRKQSEAQTDDDRARVGRWYEAVRWWQVLRRVNFPVGFGAWGDGGSAAKRAKLE